MNLDGLIIYWSGFVIRNIVIKVVNIIFLYFYFLELLCVEKVDVVFFMDVFESMIEDDFEK